MNDQEKSDFLIKICDMFEELNLTKADMRHLIRDLRSALLLT